MPILLSALKPLSNWTESRMHVGIRRRHLCVFVSRPDISAAAVSSRLVTTTLGLSYKHKAISCTLST